MAIEIIGTGKAVPPNRVTNDDLAARIDTSDEWIRSHTGIGARHISGPETATSDLALEAAEGAIGAAAAKTGETREDIIASLDLIVTATASPDYTACPSVSCIIHGKLGAGKAGAMDLSAGCTGFIYALETGASLLAADPDRRRALVIGADCLSKYLNWDDRSTCVLIGDGAGAVVIEKTAEASGCAAGGAAGERRGLLRTVLRADGTGTGCIMFKHGGTRYPFKKGEVVETPTYFEMNGQAVYNFAVKAITRTIQELLEKEGLSLDDVARIVPHQANARIVQAAAKRLGVAEEKFFLNIAEYANTSAASIPIALDECSRAGGIKKGDLVMTVGFGGGLTYGGNLFVW